jgi:hypothetical protein
VPHAHLGPRGPQGPLIHAGLPCESARLVMQGWTFAGDAARRKTEVERGGIRSLVFQPPGSNCQLAASRGAIMVVSHRGCERGRSGQEGQEASHGPGLQMLVRTEVCVGSLVAWKPCVTCPGRALSRSSSIVGHLKASPFYSTCYRARRFIYKSAMGL